LLNLSFSPREEFGQALFLPRLGSAAQLRPVVRARFPSFSMY
jgi:hypothetical protein